MFKAGLFDLDNTLTDSINLSIRGFIHCFRRHLQKEYTPAEVYALFGPSEQGIFDAWGEDLGRKMMDDFLEFYRRRHNELAGVYPGIASALNKLKRKMPLAVITGKGLEPAAITLERTGLAPLFASVVSGSCVKQHKPHPEGIEMALDTLGIPPRQAFYLGDSPADIQAARRAGVAALAALWGTRERDALLCCQPDAAFANPEEFCAWVLKTTP